MGHTGAMRLPVFPLGSVLFPGMVLPLRIFEPRYLAMLSELDSEDPTFGVVLIERGHEVGGGDARFATGTRARVLGLGHRDDHIVLAAIGTSRFAVTEWLPEDPYPVAEVDDLPDLIWSTDCEAPFERAREALAAWRRRMVELGEVDLANELDLLPDPVMATWQLAVNAPLSELDQQDLVSARSTNDLLIEIADRTNGVLELMG